VLVLTVRVHPCRALSSFSVEDLTEDSFVDDMKLLLGSMTLEPIRHGYPVGVFD